MAIIANLKPIELPFNFIGGPLLADIAAGTVRPCLGANNRLNGRTAILANLRIRLRGLPSIS
jgi:hypothetical protein